MFQFYVLCMSVGPITTYADGKESNNTIPPIPVVSFTIRSLHFAFSHAMRIRSSIDNTPHTQYTLSVEHTK